MSTEVAKRLFNVTEYYRMGDVGVLTEDDGIELIEGKLYDRITGEKRRFTVEEYYQLLEAGVLTEDDRVELIEGEIIEMNPVGKRHAACVKRLNTLFSSRVGQAAIVSVQDPINLNDRSDPLPDLALLRPRADFYAHAHPTPADGERGQLRS